ncbi:MAG: hypothetical protein RSD22_10995 [Romboutsia sp.]
MNDHIKYIGINENLPTDIKYFKEEIVDGIFLKKEISRPIEEVVSLAVNSKINSIKLINTSVRTSNEGRKLSGKKLLVEVTLSYTVRYTSNTIEKYLYILKNDITKIVYIVVPKEIDDCKIEDFVRKKKVQVQPFIEDLYIENRCDSSVYIRTLLLLNANIKM